MKFDDPNRSAGENDFVPAPKKFKKVLVFGILVIVILVAVYSLRTGMLRSSATWQTVFLNNGQAYFGHLSARGDTYVLSNVFYLRTNPNFQATTPPTAAFDIVRLGGELHGPENSMYVPKTAILFWENMKTDSQVVQAIEGFLKSSK